MGGPNTLVDDLERVNVRFPPGVKTAANGAGILPQATGEYRSNNNHKSTGNG